ncbi:MAG: MerR family transcriptional regulator [Chromatiales bacterium]|jgi:DNA-binding transcriptional MerR regulator|nr:MerR family transcriptional regulator [Chromatiales bacterium]MDX9766785.1 MerR family transcriptional regulator [Ectothiorhodospiraceae bacterium]
MKHLTLGRLARKVGLARASLLYYEAIGLLRPACRSTAGYRLYGEAEIARLETIRRFREAGLSLATIELMLRQEGGASARILERHLLHLNDEVAGLRARQQRLATLLAQPAFQEGRPPRDKAQWVALLRQSGFDDHDMWQWHAAFENDDPASHAAFLRSLGLPEKEVAAIRRHSRAFPAPMRS